MPRNASGVYTLPAGNPVEPGTTIDAAWANDTLEDMANEITNSLSRTGAGGMIAPFRIADGTVTAPGLAFLNETGTGLYRSGAGSAWFSVLGVNVAQFSTVGLTVPFGKALTAAGNASVAGTFSVGGATTLGSSLAVTGALTATGGVSGNVAGNVTATTGTSTFNDMVVTGSLDMTAGSSATITGLSTPTNASDAANKGYVDAQVATRLALTGGTMSGVIAMGNSKITGLATPTADQDAATKAYVDSIAQGLDVKGSCRAATTGNITLSGAQTIDGVAIIAGDRVLVKDQSTAANNGIYVAAAGSWSRATDADTWNELVGAFTFVEEGTVNDNSGWVCTSPAGGTLGVTAVTWEQFSGAGQITAGAGMYKSGNTINVGTASSARIVVGTDDIDLATTGVTASTYKSVTVDAYGRVTAGTNPTTLAGFGITDAYTQTQVNDALALKLNLTGGTMSGVIAMGANKITGLADPTLAQDAATKNYIDTIFGSTTSAAASAAAAASSAASASSSATSAASSATSAATSATDAANTLITFNNEYLGSKSSNPTVNNTGGALVAGNLYWNSTVPEMRVYNGSAWVSAYLPSSSYLPVAGGTMTGNITFSGNGLGILADFSNATEANRFTFQTTGANTYTSVGARPSGSGTASYFQAYNAADITNAAYAYIGISATQATISSSKLGSGTALPLSLTVNGNEGLRVETTGALTVTGGTANGVAYLNGSKVLTTGSALTFDGTNFAVGGSASSFSGYGTASVNGATGGIFDAKVNGVRVGSFFAEAGSATLATATNVPLVFNIFNSEQMRLTSTGLGIGTSSPISYARLTLEKSGGDSAIALIKTGGAQTAYLAADGTNTWIGSSFGSTGKKFFVSLTAPDSAATIDTSGNLGLGVTPSAWATIVPAMQIGNSSYATYANRLYAGANWYYNGGDKYIASDYATLYQQASGTHIWYTAPSGTAGNAISFTQAMTLDASGRLLVGFTSDQGGGNLQVSGTGRIGSLDIGNSTSNSAMWINGSDFGFGTYYGNALKFLTGNTERARITSSGDLLVGQTTTGLVNSNSAAIWNDGNGRVITINHAGSPAGSRFMQFGYSGTQIGSITVASSSSVAYNTSSDYRLKEDIAPMTGALAKVQALKPVTYKWKADGSDGEGFIAHELQEVCPQAVTGEKDAVDAEGKPVYQGIDTSFLVATLTAAIQELNAKVEALTTEIQTLKGN